MSTTITRRARAMGKTPAPRKRVSPAQRSKNIAAYFFVGPFVLAFLGLFVVPLIYSGYLSLFKTQLVGGTVFVAFDNYAQALADPAFLGSIGRMSLFLVIQVPVMLLLSLLIALALDSGRVRGSRFVRLAVFVPYAVPGVVAALMWGYLYGKDFGPLGQIARAFGFGTPDFLSSENVLASIMNIVIWQFVGYNMIIMFAALRSVPAELYDAAQVDGAGQWRIAWSIKIPAIRPAIMLTVIFSVIGTFQLFNEPNLLYSVAPNAIGTAFSPNLYAYNVAFINQNVNYAAALAFLLGIVIMIVSYVVQLSAQRRERASA